MRIIGQKHQEIFAQVEHFMHHVPQTEYELLLTDDFTCAQVEEHDVVIFQEEKVPVSLGQCLTVIATWFEQEAVSAGHTNGSSSPRWVALSISQKREVEVKKSGKVTLVGFGPGNPDFLTLAGEKAMKTADVIFHDDLLSKEYLQKYRAELIYVGKRKGRHSADQDNINELMLREALQGKSVVRLKGGDPMIFAHGGEEVAYLQSHQVEVQVIPGISTALALASLTKVPLTHRKIASSVSFISGRAAETEFPNTDTVVCYMAGFNFPSVASQAIAQGRNPQTPVLLVTDVSMPTQQEFFYTLETLSKETKALPTPIIGVIGDVVNLRHKNESEIQKELYLYTGSESIKPQEGVRIIKQSMIELVELDDKSRLYDSIDGLEDYQWIVFTSRFAVKFFFQALHANGMDSRSLSSLKFATVGKTTSKALQQKGILADLESSDGSTIGLIEAFSHIERKGKVLIPRSDVALNVLPSGMEEQGWEVNALPAFHSRMPENLRPLDLSLVDGIIFTSPACVDHFLRLYGRIPQGKVIVCKGKLTQERVNNIKNNEVENNTNYI